MSLVDDDVETGRRRSPETCSSGARASLDPRFAVDRARRRPEDLRLEPLFLRDPLAEWGRGPVTLLGDAAHPVLPHTAQGAALALEDAVALGLVLGAPGDPARGAATLRAGQIEADPPRRARRPAHRRADDDAEPREDRCCATPRSACLPGIVLSGTLRLHARDPHASLRIRMR